MENIGQALCPWVEGTLDLHHINTGRGDAAFCILPDGTTMLLDAGELDPTDPRVTSPRNTAAKPDGSRPPYEWIARYIQRMAPQKSSLALDYALITHFHDDHFGTVSELAGPSRSGAFKLTGITGVGEFVPIRTLLDRGYPAYDYPISLDGDELKAMVQENPPRSKLVAEFIRTMENYRAFMAWHQTHNDMIVDRFVPGRDDQIVLVHEPEAYPGFQVRNVCANGEVWTGVGKNTEQHIPPISSLGLHNLPDENQCSCAVLIRYGRFAYFSGGDIPGVVELDTPSWADLETPVARAVGAVDVHVTNHHGYRNTHNAFFVKTLRPRVIVQQNWSADQPGHGVLKRLTSTWLYPGPRDLFATDILEATRIVIGDAIERAYKSMHGHILVRVEPGGARYRVIILDDADEASRVKAVYGPYESRSGGD
ncbi:MAG: hypothetical protein JXA89_06190 [Anaerolineae bacterium]|nr:hypothetical protein [Anaerolineae bacterium]